MMKVDLPYSPTVAFGHLLQRYETSFHKGTCTGMFTAALFVIGQSWKSPTCPLMSELLTDYGTSIPRNTTRQ